MCAVDLGSIVITSFVGFLFRDLLLSVLLPPTDMELSTTVGAATLEGGFWISTVTDAGGVTGGGGTLDDGADAEGGEVVGVGLGGAGG